MRKSHKQKVQSRREKRWCMAQERISKFFVKRLEEYLNEDIKNMIGIKSFNADYLTNWNDTTNILTIDRLRDSVDLMNRLTPKTILPIKFEPYFDSEASINWATHSQYIKLKEESPWQIANTLMNS